ncbi:MAG: flagellar biosynthetic protein FliQ, partial [Gemmatimonas sp. SG8_17]
MTPTLAIEFIRNAIQVCLLVAGPLLFTALVVGVVVSLVQAITQLQEQTLTFIPKLLAVGLVLLISLPWLMMTLTEFL